MKINFSVVHIIRLFFALIGAGVGYESISFLTVAYFRGLDYLAMIAGGVIFYLLSNKLISPLLKYLQTIVRKLLKFPAVDLLAGTIGLTIGLTMAFFLSFSVGRIPLPVIGNYLPFMITIVLGYFGFQIGYKKREEWMTILSSGRKKEKAGQETNPATQLYKILDASAILDGRIADIGRTGFVDGVIVIPQFVLKELQDVADSADAYKRNRGRRGLDLLAEMQKDPQLQILITEKDYKDTVDVSNKLVKLAKEMKGKIITNDFNLSKVCKLHDIAVLHFHDLATAVKPPYLIGDEIEVEVTTSGKEDGQGLSYLDDGTMIIIEEGKKLIGTKTSIIITSIMQSSAGRMIFAKLKQKKPVSGKKSFSLSS